MITPFEEYIEGLIAPKKQDNVFQPTDFREYVGQEDIKHLLQVAIKAAKYEQRPLPNLMITGAFGLGKTVLAQLVMQEFGASPKLVDGASVNKKLPKGLVIIDEIHNLTSEVCDSLNMELDKGSVHIIGCTTNPGVLPGAFRSRFRIHQLSKYSVDELAEIAEHICRRKKVTGDKSVLISIAERSRNNARQLTMIMDQIFDLMAVNQTRYMSKDITFETFQLMGVDSKGYLPRDKDYVRALPNRPVGLNWLSSYLGIDQTTIQEEIEPYLLQTGIIDRTPQGRVKIRDI